MKGQAGMKWNSGYTVKGRIAAAPDASGQKFWYGEMKIPFKAIDARPPKRAATSASACIASPARSRASTTRGRRPGQKNFHVPQAFGTLTLK